MAVNSKTDNRVVPKVIVLDFDGVLVESVNIKEQAFKQMFVSFDKADEIIAYCLGSNSTIRHDKFKHIYENILKKEYTEDIRHRLSSEFSKLILNQIIEAPAVEGALEFLENFHGVVPMYIVSTSPPDELEQILGARGIRKYFKSIYPVPWSKKDALLDIANEENISVGEMIFIGDSPEDYQAAADARVPFIGRFSNKPLNQFNIPVIKNLTEMKDYFVK